MRIQRSRQSGFALLLSLLVLLLATVAMASITRLSLGESLKARRAQEELQTRWGMLSVRAAVLPRAETILSEAESHTSLPVANVRENLTLGDQRFELLISDEQAKVNINAVGMRASAEATKRLVQGLVQAQNESLEIQLTPIDRTIVLEHSNPQMSQAVQLLTPFGTLEQFLTDCRPAVLMGSGRDFPLADVTCWGDGQLNYRRASRRALAAILAPLADAAPTDALIKLRSQTPGLSVGQAFEQLNLPFQQQGKVIGLMTQGSQCHSLWIAVHTGSPTDEGDARAVHYRLIVHDDTLVRSRASADAGGTEYVFDW